MQLQGDRPDVAIVIATFNAANYLAATLESISSQVDFAPNRVSVVLVDGGSTDETVEIARQSGVVDLLISEPDRGIYDAMNKGADRATSRWLHFLNAGDSFENIHALSNILAALDEAELARTPWMVAGALNLGGGMSAPNRLISNIPHIWWRHAWGIQPHCHQATWFRRDVFLASGSYSLNFGTASDFDLIVRFGMLGHPHELTQTTINYLGGGVSEKKASQTPKILHAVRVERMQLTGPLRVLDRGITHLVTIINAARKYGGLAKRFMKRRRSAQG